jgi:hypothetical protein
VPAPALPQAGQAAPSRNSSKTASTAAESM